MQELDIYLVYGNDTRVRETTTAFEFAELISDAATTFKLAVDSLRLVYGAAKITLEHTITSHARAVASAIVFDGKKSLRLTVMSA